MIGTIRSSDGRKKQAVEIVDFGNRSHGRARIGGNGFLVDGNGGRKPPDFVDLRIVVYRRHDHSRVGRKAFEVSPLSFGINRIEGERRFSGTRNARDRDELVFRNLYPDVFEIVGFCTDDFEKFGHRGITEIFPSLTKRRRTNREYILFSPGTKKFIGPPRIRPKTRKGKIRRVRGFRFAKALSRRKAPWLRSRGRRQRKRSGVRNTGKPKREEKICSTRSTCARSNSLRPALPVSKGFSISERAGVRNTGKNARPKARCGRIRARRFLKTATADTRRRRFSEPSHGRFRRGFESTRRIPPKPNARHGI